MAQLVLAVGVPHPPRLIYEIEHSPGLNPTEELMKVVRGYVEKSESDVIIEVDSDHFVNFFYNNLPSFCVGLAEEAGGPQESWCPMPRYTLKGHVPFATGLLKYGVRSNFDLAAAHELRPDHSLMVPLHFLNPNMEIPVVPLYTNGFASPLPLGRRCLALGRMMAKFIAAWDGPERVAIIASGALAGDVGGPVRGWTDQKWVDEITVALKDAKYDSLARKATEERMAYAGNNSGELLNWITMAGAVGETKPAFVEDHDGSGFAVWELGK